MLTAYINAAMRSAHYEILEGGEGYVGSIPGLQGVWANADTLEGCRDELREVLEEWIILGLKMNHRIPVIDGIELNFEKMDRKNKQKSCCRGNRWTKKTFLSPPAMTLFGPEIGPKIPAIVENKKLLERIILNPKIMAGKPIIQGTRITVDFILNLLAHGASESEILNEYKALTVKDIQACFLFATKSLESTDFMPLMEESA